VKQRQPQKGGLKLLVLLTSQATL